MQLRIPCRKEWWRWGIGDWDSSCEIVPLVARTPISMRLNQEISQPKIPRQAARGVGATSIASPDAVTNLRKGLCGGRLWKF